jgi:hypothetical protein
MVISNGNHGVEGIAAGAATTDRILCLHAPLRARALLTGKLDQGRRVIEDEGRQDYWHVRRWWRLAREGNIDAEWAANSYEDGSLVVGGHTRPLITDFRLRDAVAAFVPLDTDEDTDLRDALHPAMAAYLLALNTVPGELSEIDFRALAALDRVQREHGITGDLLQWQARSTQTAILLGHLARLSGERLLVCYPPDMEPFPGVEDGPEDRIQDRALGWREFVRHYLRFHDELPLVVRGGGNELQVEAGASAFRFVDVDGNNANANAPYDIHTAEKLLAPGGIIAFDVKAGFDDPVSVSNEWAGLFNEQFVPLCLTDHKLYGVHNPGDVDWGGQIDDWVTRNSDVECAVHMMGRWPVRRLSIPPPAGPPVGLIDVPSGEESAAVDGPEPIDVITDDYGEGEKEDRRHGPTARWPSVRQIVRLIAPPIAVSIFRSAKARYGAMRDSRAGGHQKSRSS